MSKTANKMKTTQKRVGAEEFYKATPHKNRAMRLDKRGDGTTLASIPMKKPKCLVPPFSWILPYSEFRRVELDSIGTSVLDLCDGKRTVENIIELFAKNKQLSFREAQLAVGQFLPQLAERSIIAIVGKKTKNTSK